MKAPKVEELFAQLALLNSSPADKPSWLVAMAICAQFCLPGMMGYVVTHVRYHQILLL